MNLSELGEYKHKVAALLAQDDPIINLLLGPVDDDTDTDEMLLGDKSISTGHIYELLYLQRQGSRCIPAAACHLLWP